LKVRTLVQLADLLWEKGDEAYAQQLFLNTQELLRGMKPSKAGDTPSGEDRDMSLTPDKYNRLQALLIQKLTRHDAALAERLMGEGSVALSINADIKIEENVRLANELMRKGQYAEASRQAEQALGGRLSGLRNLTILLTLLNNLRKSDLKAADNLFLQTLVQLKRQPEVTANDVLIVGNYLFTGAGVAEHLRSQVFISPARVGDTHLQADISIDRPSLMPAVVRAYLNVATEVLGRPAVDAGDAKLKAAAAQLLLPKARRFTPDLVPRLSILAAASGVVPPADERVGTERVADPRARNADLDSVLKEVDKLAEKDARHKYILERFRYFYLKRDFMAAMAVADKSSDADLHNRLADLVRFAQAASLIEQGRLDPVEQAASRLGSPSLRQLLGLSVARTYLKREDTVAAENAVNAVFNDARRGAASVQQLYPLLNAVEMLATVDASFAAGRLNDLVSAFNAVEAKGAASPPNRLLETVRYKDHSIIIPVSVPGINPGNFYLALRPLTLTDPRGTVLAVLEIKNESVLSEGMQALARALLD
ncbi:MAG: hypothetical protein H0X14_01475, partial [Acidobacteria bacterium]|nr:hypothetical protein [Acidobacteriota bacterium]